ncbi:Bll2366 protein [Leucobacter sp. 7(1)]|uniref:O-antigen ligase family protein n=1 Tax=Leucobacter sp. 7(1) TaxID=1255613 RepID=UPI00097ED895|nr:O-antigen ligase family protein [Leucobacter sp. 7(1)]SJN13019.1 Bll2366 protein [Leucobacter sp. 7(1)]
MTRVRVLRGRGDELQSIRAGDRWGLAAIWISVFAILVFFPGAFSRWDMPKICVFLIAVVLACVAWPAGRVSRIVASLCLAGAVVLGVAALLSAQPLTALGGRWPRSEGLVLLPVVAAAIWAGARLLGPAAGQVRHGAWTRSVSLGSLVLGCVSVLEAVGLRPIASDLSRPGALLGNATDQGLVGAAFVAVVLPVVVDRIARGRALRTWLFPGSALLAGVVTVACSGSRAGMLALGVGVVVTWLGWAGPRWRGSRSERLRGLWAGLAVLGIAGVTVLTTPLARDRLLGVSNLAAQTVADRGLIWRETLQLILDAPWWGVGPAGYADAIAVRHGPEWFATVTPGTVLESPHNWALQAAVSGGIVLLLIAVLLVGALGSSAVQALRCAGAVSGLKNPSSAVDEWSLRVAGAAGGLSALCIGWLTHFPVPATALLAGLLAGVVCAQGTRGAEGPRWRRTRLGLVSAWCVALAFVTAAEYPLAGGVGATSAESADRAFVAAAALRPWDAELPSIAAQTFAAHANGGAHGAGELGVRWADRALALDPAGRPAREARAVSLRAVGDLIRAQEEFAALVRDQPHDPRMMMQLGVTTLLVGEVAEGRRLLERAVELAPEDTTVRDAADWAAAVAE